MRIAVGAGNAEDAFAAAQLKEEIESGSPAKVRVVEGGEGEIVLARDGAPAEASANLARYDGMHLTGTMSRNLARYIEQLITDVEARAELCNIEVMMDALSSSIRRNTVLK